MLYLNKIAVISLTLLLITSISVFSQNDRKPVTIKPSVNAGDMIFGYNQIDDIQISGSEVNALLEVKTMLKPVIDEIISKNVADNTPIKFEVQLIVANNFVAFLERSKLKASDAPKYKRLVDAFRTAAQEAASLQK